MILLPNRTILEISGDDKRAFLQGIITNDVETISPTHPIYTLILTPQGKFLFDFFVVESGEHWLIDCATSRAAALKQKLLMYKLRSKIEIRERPEYAVIALLHNEAPPQGSIAYADPRSEKMGTRAIVNRAELSGINPDDSEYDLRRISITLAEGEKDMVPEKSYPLHFGMDAFGAIDFEKGCYVGQEVTARTKHRGVVRRKLYRISASSMLPMRGTEIKCGESIVGEVCSSVGLEGLAILEIEAVEKNQTLRVNNLAITLLR